MSPRVPLLHPLALAEVHYVSLCLAFNLGAGDSGSGLYVCMQALTPLSSGEVFIYGTGHPLCTTLGVQGAREEHCCLEVGTLVTQLSMHWL